MAPPKSKNVTVKRSKDSSSAKFLKKYISSKFLSSLVFDPAQLHIVAVLILVAEFVLNIIIVEWIPYTEIDWKAYMQECEGFLNGTTNYSSLKGDTGPLVYPAGFVYIYTILYYLTSSGSNVKFAQYIFILIYLLQLFFVLRLYMKSRKVPPYVLVITTFTSYRIHSIYVLRLFNDPIAILFTYAAINMFLDQKWTVGSMLFSMGVSIKMNILLFAPAILLLYVINLGYLKTIYQLAVCGIVQLILGAPFLLTYPIDYVKGSFNLGRVFEHKWTVNYRFLSVPLFESKTFHVGLLALHVLLLVLFFRPCYQYMQSYCRLRVIQQQLQPQIDRKNAEIKAKKSKPKRKLPKQTNDEKLSSDQEKFLKTFEKSLQNASGTNGTSQTTDSPVDDEEEQAADSYYSIHFDKSTQLALLPIFLVNFIGITCARSLHYQFYIWYFHSLPYLAWFTDYGLTLKFLLLGLIEYCWNTYPSTDYSSFVLHCCHVILLIGIAKSLFKTQTASEKLINKDV